MRKAKKWEIPRLASEKKFRQASCRILSHRLFTVLEWIVTFKHDRADEDIHQLRIAIRRLRYPLETMISQFDRKVMQTFIEELNDLQDAAGAARDVDVLAVRLRALNHQYSWHLRKIVYLDLEDQRRELYRKAADAIDIFAVSPALYDFKKEINYAEYESELLLRSANAESPPTPPVSQDDMEVPQ